MNRTFAIGAAFFAIAIVATVAVQCTRRPAPPRDVEEAAERMRSFGLHTVKSRSAVTGSTRPITQDDATNLHFGRTCDWTGSVRAWPIASDIPDVHDLPNIKAVNWGGVLLAGDPDLVDKLAQ